MIDVLTLSSFANIMDKVIEKLKPKDIQKVEVINRPFKFATTLFKRGTTTSNKKPDDPTFILKNTRKDDVRIFRIGIVPDAAFKTNGNALIKNHDGEIISIKTGDLTDVSDIPINMLPNGQHLKRGESIEVFLWNDDNITSVSLTVAALIGEFII